MYQTIFKCVTSKKGLNRFFECRIWPEEIYYKVLLQLTGMFSCTCPCDSKAGSVCWRKCSAVPAVGDGEGGKFKCSCYTYESWNFSTFHFKKTMMCLNMHVIAPYRNIVNCLFYCLHFSNNHNSVCISTNIHANWPQRNYCTWKLRESRDNEALLPSYLDLTTTLHGSGM